MSNSHWPLSERESNDLYLILLSLEEGGVLKQDEIQQEFFEAGLTPEGLLKLIEFIQRPDEEIKRIIGYDALIAECETSLSTDFANVLRTVPDSTQAANTMSLLLKNNVEDLQFDFEYAIEVFLDDDLKDDFPELVAKIDFESLQEFYQNLESHLLRWFNAGGPARVAAQMPALAAVEIEFLHSLKVK